ncbi:hypothetical protein [Ekhidna sp.]
MKLKLKWWWYILPAYLTLWSIGFSLWNLFDGEGMMVAFGIDTGGASDFIMLNSASRYVAIGVGMIIGIWIFRTYSSILTVLIIRFVMDVLDLYSGLQADIIQDISGVVQSLLMFLIPNLLAIISLFRLNKKLLTEGVHRNN